MAEWIAVLGNLGEFVGAIGVLITLIYLAIQVRHSRVLMEANGAAMEENSRLLRVSAMERYNDVVGNWRGRLIEHPDVANLWDRASRGEAFEGTDAIRFENLWIDWVNSYRSNFSRAQAVGQEGLEHQAVMSVVVQMRGVPLLLELWEWARGFNEMSSADFVQAVDRELSRPDAAKLTSVSPLRNALSD